MTIMPFCRMFIIKRSFQCCRFILEPFHCTYQSEWGKVQLALLIILLFSAFARNLWSQGGHAMSFAIKTTAFSDGGPIPKKYTCDGADLSPGFTWADTPAGTQSLALIADDPDAPVGTWTHWTVWNIPPEAALPEGVAKVESFSDGTRQGKNDFKRIGYGGPCPPLGKPHRYFFKLYALDAKIDLKAGANRNELERAMKGHVLAQTELMGRYGR
jgi:Raf kinase inhibitor-like YbhB/YbcL family protein